MRRRIVSPTTEKPSGNTDDDGSKTRVVPGIGEDGCNLPSPSGVNTKGKLAQTITVLVLLLSIGLATHVVSQGFKGLSNALDEHSPMHNNVSSGLPFSVIVEAEIKADRMDEFMGMIETNALESRKESGCIRFGTCFEFGAWG